MRWLKPLPRKFYLRPAPDVARDLIGKILVHKSRAGLCAGRIVEVEAYLGVDDPASHAFRGLTPRNGAMFEKGGRAYVYFTYGAHFCVNVVTGPRGVAQAVLIRALEPLEGIELMKKRRRSKRWRTSATPPNRDNCRDLCRDLCSGPGKLTQALGIDFGLNNADLISSPLTIHPERPAWPKAVVTEIALGPRIGISKAVELNLRFFDAKSPYVSGAKKRGTGAFTAKRRQ